MTPESKDGRENYMPKPVTWKLQLNHRMLSTEVSNSLMIFWFFPRWREALRDNKSFKVSVETAYLQNGICNSKSELQSITFTHLHPPPGSLQLPPASPRAGQGQEQPPRAIGKGSCALQSWERSRDAEQPLESCKCFESSWPSCTEKLIW